MPANQPGRAWRDDATGTDSIPVFRASFVTSRPPSGSIASAKPRPRLTTLAGIVIAAGLIWRVMQYALGLPVWGDEAFVGVNFLMRDFAGMIKPLVYGQICPLFFMWGELAVSRVLGYSEWALRLLPFLVGLAGLALFIRFARHVLPRTAALMAIAIFASSYFIVRHAAEIKPYSGDLLVSLGLIALAVAVAEHPRSWVRWAGLILLAGAGIWSSYPSMFVGGAVGLYLTARLIRMGFPKGFLAGWLLFGLVLIGNAAWMYFAYAKPHAAQAADVFELASWQRAFPPTDRPWTIPFWLLYIHTGYLFAYPQGGHPPGSIITLLLFLVGAWRLYRKDRDLLLLLIAPFVLTFIAAALHAYPYGGSARVAQHLAPPICLLAGLGLSVLLRAGLRNRRLRLGLTVATIVFTVIPVAGIARAIIQPYKSEEVYRRRQAVESLVEQTGPADRWVLFNSIDRNDYAPWLGDWRGIGAQFLFDVMRFAPVEVRYSPPPDSVQRPPDGTLWLFVYYAKRDDKEKMVPFSDEQLEAYLGNISARLGPPQREEVVFVDRKKAGGEKKESLIIYRWPAKDGPVSADSGSG
ncbi:MAG: glycosyltransferase family 39 protein [Phycisphaerae bacterium]|nr:glycosyltransferase family 39 protein [Phycisphaerae bacterium]